MVLVDDDRRYVEVNAAAERALGPDLPGKRRVDDLTPPYLIAVMEAGWSRLMETGCVASPFNQAPRDRSYLGVTYYALANALPGLHVIAFVAAGSGDHATPHAPDPSGDGHAPLTPRELEILSLAAEGHNGPMIARSLTVSPATVRTHFQNIYAKLGVRDRAGAVAQALRMGLIA